MDPLGKEVCIQVRKSPDNWCRHILTDASNLAMSHVHDRHRLREKGMQSSSQSDHGDVSGLLKPLSGMREYGGLMGH